MRLSSSRSAIAALAALCIATGAPARDLELPERAPVPRPRGEALKAAEPPAAADALPADEAACRAELAALGAAFAPVSPVHGEGGCAVPFPLQVTALTPAIALRPAAILNCRTARAAARFFGSAGAAAARKRLGAGLTAVIHASAYICRPINGGARLSEHAYGNALDVSGIVLSDGRHVEVHGHDDADRPEAKLLRDIRNAACGPFTTVLGPGTNADHSDHFHFDMKERRTPYCR